MMPQALDPKAAAGTKAVFQFEVSGAEEFVAHLVVENGQATYNDGPAESPDLTIKTPAEVWLAISRGEINDQKAFFSGQFKAKGDLGLLLKMRNFFKR